MYVTKPFHQGERIANNRCLLIFEVEKLFTDKVFTDKVLILTENGRSNEITYSNQYESNKLQKEDERK